MATIAAAFSDYSLDDVWQDFERNGEDGGLWGDYDELLRGDIVASRVVSRPRVSVSPPVAVRLPAETAPSSPDPPMECQFCRNNGQPLEVYTSHRFKDARGNCECPVLRRYVCPICGAKDKKAHTVKYCPQKRILTEADTLLLERKKKNRQWKRVN